MCRWLGKSGEKAEKLWCDEDMVSTMKSVLLQLITMSPGRQGQGQGEAWSESWGHHEQFSRQMKRHLFVAYHAGSSTQLVSLDAYYESRHDDFRLVALSSEPGLIRT